MYTVQNISSQKVSTPYGEFAGLEIKTFHQDIKGSDDGKAYTFFKESSQFTVTGGTYQNPGDKGDKGDTGAAGTNGTNGTNGTSIALICSGLIAAVKNAARYAVGAMGGVGQATLANGEIRIPAAGSLSTFSAAPDVAVDGLASVNVSVFINGVASALTATFVNADGTTAKTAAGPVAVAAGNLITFEVIETADVTPVAKFQASAKFTAS
jgi:hypothetical protein